MRVRVSPGPLAGIMGTFFMRKYRAHVSQPIGETDMESVEEYLTKHAVLDGMGNMDGYMVPLSVAMIAADMARAGKLRREKYSHHSEDYCCACRDRKGWYEEDIWVACMNCSPPCRKCHGRRGEFDADGKWNTCNLCVD